MFNKTRKQTTGIYFFKAVIKEQGGLREEEKRCLWRVAMHRMPLWEGDIPAQLHRTGS